MFVCTRGPSRLGDTGLANTGDSLLDLNAGSLHRVGDGVLLIEGLRLRELEDCLEGRRTTAA